MRSGLTDEISSLGLVVGGFEDGTCAAWCGRDGARRVGAICDTGPVPRRLVIAKVKRERSNI